MYIEKQCFGWESSYWFFNFIKIKKKSRIRIMFTDAVKSIRKEFEIKRVH